MIPKYLGGHYIRREFTGRPCPYCAAPMTGERYPTKDHVQPKSTGGTLETCIIVCNGNRGSMTLSEFVQWLEARNDPRAEIVRKAVEFTRCSGGNPVAKTGF
jgi:hypothetical protein